MLSADKSNKVAAPVVSCLKSFGHLLIRAAILCPGSKVLWITYHHIKWEIHLWFTQMSDFEKLNFNRASPVHSLPSPTHSLTCSKSEMKNRKGSQSRESFIEADLEDFSPSSINWPSISSVYVCVCVRSVDFYFSFSLVPEALWGRVRIITGPCKWKLCALIFPLAGRLESCLFLFPVHKCFPLWHVVFIYWTQESVCLQVIFLSCSARVMFFKPGSGNFFQCVTQGYDNYPFSISTVDVFIVLNVHLPVSLLFRIMEMFSAYLLWH